MYSTYNEGKSVVAERFIRTLKNKLCKHMAAVSKNVHFDVLDDIVEKYNNSSQNNKKELQKTSQEKFRIEKVIKRKGDKLHVKWKGYDNSFNSWIDKKDIV